MDTEIEPGDTYEALLQFLYLAPTGLIQIDLDGKIGMLNPMSSQLLMPLSGDGKLTNLFTALHAVAPQLRALVADFKAVNGIICDALRIDLRARQAGPRCLSISLLKLDGQRIMAALHDATGAMQHEQHMLTSSLDRAARIDPLTQLHNRWSIQEQLQRLLKGLPQQGDTQFAVLFLNCDRFKQINDTLGHGIGDRLIASISERLRHTLRANDYASQAPASDCLAARFGGDEFVVVLPGVRRIDDVFTVARRLVASSDQPYRIGPHQISCKASIGVLFQADMAGDADDLLRDASIAMAAAKLAGGGRYAVFTPAMREQAARRGSLEADLRGALAAGQLFVVYQPVVGFDGAGGIERCTGVEALVRWHHPLRGIVAPLEFIGIAEECGLIGAIGEFVLATACADFVQWQAALGPRAPRLLAVNLSRAQIVEPAWLARVLHILKTSGMPATQLQLEVTESLAAQDAVIQQRLHAVKAAGVQLALDDFGTGYSSLSSLHLLPVDTVKIDRSFVSQADSSAHHRTLIEATILVARSLGMSTVAEGIETKAQAEVVMRLGCDKGQGYLFSRPLAPPALLAWLME